MAFPTHVHHGVAHEWFRVERARGWATCPLTQAGFVRISANRRVMPEPRTPAEAIDYLAALTALPGHRFWSDETSFVDASYLYRERIVGSRQVTDAHLLAIALRHQGSLATLDGAIRQLVPPGHDPDQVVEVLDASRGRK